LSRIGPQFVLLFSIAGALGSVSASAQSNPETIVLQPSANLVTIRSVKVMPGKDGPVLEILSDRPISPVITKLEGPLRLVIDLPKASMAATRKRIDFRNEEIRGIRLNQFQSEPPIGRIVVDLVKPTAYTWDAAGNHLMVRLHAIADISVRAPSIPAFTQGVQPLAVPVSPGAGGTVVLAGSRIAAGSSVTAGAETAILSLARGGVVHVCPGTTVSITSSQNGSDLLLGMSTGALEAHYALDASADSILTPDFRILLTGPGVFHYAVSADSRGNTCVRALPGNTASVTVSELMGDGTYQVKPEEKIAFRSGRLNQIDTSVPDSCGCPPPAVPVLRTAAPPVADDLPATVRLTLPTDVPKPVSPQSNSERPASRTTPSHVTLSIINPETAPLPPSQPEDIHVQVEAPLVFRAGDSAQAPPTREGERLPMTHSPPPQAPQATVLPPPAAQPKPRNHGFFGKVKGFFSGLFH
jgi:AMIN domain-containing protein